MRIILYVIGALIALFVVIIVVGYALPAKHRASRQAEYAAPPDTVYSVITDVEEFPAWRSKVDTVDMVPGGETVTYREKGSDGTILYAVEQSVPGRRVVTRIADKSLPFGGTWTYDLAPSGAGTRVRITEDGEVYNPLFRFMSKFVFGHTSTIDTYLADLGKRLKSEAVISD